MAVELPQVLVTLADISDTALDYTTQNAMMLGVNDRIENVKWDALTEPPQEWLGRFDLIVANPPYIPVADVPNLHPDVRDGEPREALTDGGDGLSFYRRWAETLPKIMKPEGRLLVEVGDGATDRVGMILRDSFKEIGQYKDLGETVRAIEFER